MSAGFIPSILDLDLVDQVEQATNEESIEYARRLARRWNPSRNLMWRGGIAVLGLTATDLWPGEGWNFVFGQGDLRRRVGVYSLARYGDPAIEAEYRRFFRRTLKVATHEMVSLPKNPSVSIAK